MIRQLLACLLTLVSLAAASAQPIPTRLEPLAKNERFKLERVHGLPRVPHGASAISADGKLALYVENFVDEEKPLKYRLLVYDLVEKS